ncbi:hypothetical protein RI367_001990 [Sorochytrium milnesiophthora]
MAQSIVVQVGQCGNQVFTAFRNRFWDAVLTEHARHNKAAVYDEPLSTFFRNVDTRYKSSRNIAVGDGKGKVVGLRARKGIMIDMEEGVIHEFGNSHLRELFDPHQIISDTSGSGNNWSVGYHTYGPQHREGIVEATRKEAESCDALQSFFIVQSLGGGTGSGLGSYVTELYADEFPDVYRFNTVVMPSKDDDVVTSPYNSVLSLQKLTDYSDCVLPIENAALFEICDRVLSKASTAPAVAPATTALAQQFAGLSVSAQSGKRADLRKAGGSIIDSTGVQKTKPFDAMNNIVANLLLNLTSSMRFEGSLNVDINEITMNLVPFPRLKYLLSSMTPLYSLANVGLMERRLDQIFLDAFSRESQLICADPKRSVYMACGLIVRGAVEVSDIRRNIERVKSQLQFAWWNQDGWKTGHCSVAPVNQPYSLLTLANNCCIQTPLQDIRARFAKLFTRKANLHHYTKQMQVEDFRSADASLRDLIDEYSVMERNEQPAVEDWEAWARSQHTATGAI